MHKNKIIVQMYEIICITTPILIYNYYAHIFIHLQSASRRYNSQIYQKIEENGLQCKFTNKSATQLNKICLPLK